MRRQDADPESTALSGLAAGLSLSRRRLLAIGSTALAGSMAGCIPLGGPNPRITLGAQITEPFDTDPPMALTVRIDALISDVPTRDTGFIGVALECYDAAMERIARRSLGDVTWQNADPDEQSRDTDSDEPRYYASWWFEVELELSAVPELVTFQIDHVEFEDEPRSSGLFVGRARARSPPAPSLVEARRYDGSRPPPARVVPSDYEPVRTESRSRIDEVVGEAPIAPLGYYPGRELRKLTVHLEQSQIRAGDETQAEVVAHFADGSEETVTEQARLRSTNVATATVQGAQITGRSAGTVAIEAEYITRTARTDLRVRPRATAEVAE